MNSSINELTHQFSSEQPRPPDVPAVQVFDAWNLRILQADEFSALGQSRDHLSRNQLLYLTRFGLLAPTSHNTVPQRFQVASDTGQLAIWMDRRRVLPQSDAQGRQATISCGCVVASLSIAAEVFGWRVIMHAVPVDLAAVRPCVPGTARYTEVARLSFERLACPRRSRSWLAAMLERKTLRVDFDPRVGLADELAQQMQQTVASYSELRLNLLTDAPTLTAMGKFQELADTTVYNREPFARELGQWLLLNDSVSPVGMRGREFGLSDDATARFHRGLRGQGELLPDEVAGLAKSANRAMRSSSAVAVLSVEDDTVTSRISAGRAFVELAVLLQMHGFVTSMHAAITEVTAPNMALRGRLRTTRKPIVVFCLGKPAKPSDRLRPHASRPSLSELFLHDVGLAAAS